MKTTSPFVVLRSPCDQVITWAAHRLEQAGFRTIQTFDLKTARLAHLDCPCPHHGMAQCSCQMVVLLVYHGASSPTTLIIHGNQEMSWCYLINSPQQPIDQPREKEIQAALRLELDATA